MPQSGVLMRTIISTFRQAGRNERGGALLTSLIIMSLLAAVSMTVLAVVTHETQIAGSDLRRTQTFYAAAASSEKKTSDFSALFSKTSSTNRLADLNLPNIAAETSVRAALIAGNNKSAMAGTPDQGNG